MLRHITFAALLTAVLAVSCAAQSVDIVRARVAAGYSHLRLPFNRISVSQKSTFVRGNGGFHRPGLWLEFEWTPTPWFGIENYTGLYYFPGSVRTFANIPGGKFVAPKLFDGRLTPYAVAGFGIAVTQTLELLLLGAAAPARLRYVDMAWAAMYNLAARGL